MTDVKVGEGSLKLPLICCWLQLIHCDLYYTVPIFHNGFQCQCCSLTVIHQSKKERNELIDKSVNESVISYTSCYLERIISRGGQALALQHSTLHHQHHWMRVWLEQWNWHLLKHIDEDSFHLAISMLCPFLSILWCSLVFFWLCLILHIYYF